MDAGLNVSCGCKSSRTLSPSPFAVVVSNRAKSDSWAVEIRREGQEKWEEVKTATGKSVNVRLTPTTDGKPERIQVRVRLRKNNEDYGQLSDIVYVTVNP